MSKSFSLARTASGLSHGNTLVVPKVKRVVVFVDQPHRPSDLQDAFRLLSKEGKYDRTLQRSEAVSMDELRVALHFTEVPSAGSYSLSHVMTAGIEIPVFLDVPFEELLSYGEDASMPNKEEPAKLDLEDPPQSELDDALLVVDHADPELESSRYLDLLAYRTQNPGDSELA